jgi:hypothetical protein
MNRPLLAAFLAFALVAPLMPASAGSGIGGAVSAPSAAPSAIGTTTYGAPYGGGRPVVAARPTWTLTPQAGQPLGNYVYLNGGMVVPRSTNYFFTWQGRPCQALNGSTFCQ